MCFPRDSVLRVADERAQAQAGASCKQVGCGEERKQRVEAAHCRHGMEREVSAQQRLAVPPLFKRADEACIIQPHVQFAAHNNAAEVALVQQHDGAAAAAVAHLRRSHVLGLQRAHCTECFHNFRSAAAQHRSVLEGHVIAAQRAVQPRSSLHARNRAFNARVAVTWLPRSRRQRRHAVVPTLPAA